MANTLQGAVREVPLIQKSGLAKRERIINNFARVTQFLTWPVLFIIFNILFHIRVYGRENFALAKTPFIIISNHVSFYDSFLFRIVLGLWTPLLPLRFMAVSRFDWKLLNLLSSIGVVEFVYSLFGVFIVVPGLGVERNLSQAREIIKVGGNVVMFPEGKIFLEKVGSMEHIGPFKRGAAVLMKETHAAVIPVVFHVTKHWFRRKIHINVGGPMNILPNLSVEEITQSFHVAMEILYERE